MSVHRYSALICVHLPLPEVTLSASRCLLTRQSDLHARIQVHSAFISPSPLPLQPYSPPPQTTFPLTVIFLQSVVCFWRWLLLCLKHTNTNETNNSTLFWCGRFILKIVLSIQHDLPQNISKEISARAHTHKASERACAFPSSPSRKKINCDCGRCHLLTHTWKYKCKQT